MRGLNEVLLRLGLNTSNGLYYTTDESWKKIQFPSRIKRFFSETLPDAFFCVDNKPLVLFFENPSDVNKLQKAIWNFNESPIVIIVYDNEIDVFNGFKLSDKVNGLLDRIGGLDKIDEFNYFHIVTGKTWENYQDSLDYTNRVDRVLLKDIDNARNLILKEFPQPAHADHLKENIRITNALLGKMIFVRYLIDRQVELSFNNTQKIWTNDDFCELLKNPRETERFFNYLADENAGFNGELFPLDEKDYEKIPNNAYKIIIRLLNCENLISGQQSLFNVYDFSIIPVEFISNIYEYFIGIENQVKQSAYYTPLFLVDYILAQTINKAIEDNPGDYFKILDPACGSGVFLVEALRKLIEQYISKNPGIRQNNIEQFKKDIKGIAESSIFGIDSDESAIQVAIFSVYLTFLDYMSPPEIKSFKFPGLLGKNFFCSDFFDRGATFNTEFENIHFSFIVGNPPWKRGTKDEDSLYLKYIKERKMYENVRPVVSIGNKEIAQAFLIRTSDFSREDTKCALIVTSKALYNSQSIDFRKYFLNQFLVERVFELAAVRREVFNQSHKSAISPACVLFFKYAFGKKTDTNIIEHIAIKPSRFFSLFKIFMISRQDIQYLKQDKLKEYDWLWKVLVYGSYLDFNFIIRLKSEYSSIREYLDGSHALVKQGIKRLDGNKKKDVGKLIGTNFLDLRKEIDQFYISPEHKKWNQKYVGYVYEEDGSVCEDIFTPPMLLIKETVNTKLESIAAVSSEKLIFTDKITSIKFKRKKKSDDYYLLAGLMNSSLFAYYVLHASSTAGIMIEQQINDIERFSFPFEYSSRIIANVKKLETLNSKSHLEIMTNISVDICQSKDDINNAIMDLFRLSKTERILIDYSINVIIPIIMKHKTFEMLFSPYEFQAKELMDYANLFLERFGSKFDDINKRFIVEIWHTRHIIGMFFKVISKQTKCASVEWKSLQNSSEILKLLLTMGIHK
ncbi:MAG: N-6 DNA methylase, partial [Bacteroidales bacterium]|nr:N-6 DNA methylase [Bacteroidales bacterium]